MKRFRGLLWLASTVLALSTQQAHARTFYKSNFSLTAIYKNIDHASAEAAKNMQVEVRYSDDHDYCFAYLDGLRFECSTFHPDDAPQMAKITLDRGPAKDLILAALAHIKCSDAMATSFDRLGIYLSDTIDLEFAGQDFYQEVHDEVPEAFHVWLFGLGEGKAY